MRDSQPSDSGPSFKRRRTSGPWSAKTLKAENRMYAGTGGVSAGSRASGFQPGYYNCDTGEIVISRFADGRPAPVHVLEGLPAHWVEARGERGDDVRVSASVITGFVRDGIFYTRKAAAAAISSDESEA